MVPNRYAIGIDEEEGSPSQDGVNQIIWENRKVSGSPLG